jgi:hypothetical protein
MFFSDVVQMRCQQYRIRRWACYRSVNTGKTHRIAIVCGVFYFLLYPIEQSYAILKTKLEEQMMKIAMRLTVLTLMLAAASFSQGISFSGPGMPPAPGDPGSPMPRPTQLQFTGGIA